MLDDLVENASSAAQRHHLATTTTANEGPASAAGLDVHKVSLPSLGPEADAGGGVK